MRSMPSEILVYGSIVSEISAMDSIVSQNREHSDGRNSLAQQMRIRIAL